MSDMDERVRKVAAQPCSGVSAISEFPYDLVLCLKQLAYMYRIEMLPVVPRELLFFEERVNALIARCRDGPSSGSNSERSAPVQLRD